MGTGKGGKHQIPGIRRSLVNPHARKQLIGFPYFTDITEIKPRLHAMADHIHGKCHDVHISRSLAVSEKRSLHTVSSRQHAELRIADTAAPVVVRMDA